MDAARCLFAYSRSHSGSDDLLNLHKRIESFGGKRVGTHEQFVVTLETLARRGIGGKPANDLPSRVFRVHLSDCPERAFHITDEAVVETGRFDATLFSQFEVKKTLRLSGQEYSMGDASVRVCKASDGQLLFIDLGYRPCSSVMAAAPILRELASLLTAPAPGEPLLLTPVNPAVRANWLEALSRHGLPSSSCSAAHTAVLYRSELAPS